MRVSATAPVVAVDIDGTMADYYGHFKWFAEMYMQRELKLKWGRELRGEFSEALGLDKTVYRQIKLAYRQGGMKRSIPMFANAGPVIRAIRKSGVQVWICTTRPWNRLDNIDPDTQFWLDRNSGRVDGLIYGEDKYRDLLEIVGSERILGSLDDLPENHEKAEALGINSALMSGPHNHWYRESAVGLRRVDNMTDFERLVESWKRNYDKKEESA